MESYARSLGHEHLSRDSALKKYSNKPLWLTTRDAALVTLVSLVITLCVLYVWYRVSGTPTAQQTYLVSAVQTICACFLAQYVCEYAGINNIIAESSVRYSKGTTLEKYTQGRNGVACKVALDVLRSDNESQGALWNRLDILCAANDDPYELQRVVDAREGYRGLSVEDTADLAKISVNFRVEDVKAWLMVKKDVV